MTDFTQNKKYQDIFKSAKDLFWKHGIKRVAIEEICRNAGVSKMTFYKYFANKNELVKTVFNGVIGEAMEKYDTVVHGDLPFTEKVSALFHIKLEGTKDISAEFLTDLYASQDPQMQELLIDMQKRSLNIFVDFFSDAQSKGLIRKEIKIEFMLAYMNNLSQLTGDSSLLEKYDHPQDLIMETMNFFFYGLIPPK